MNTVVKALAGFVVASALNIASEAMLELLDLSPRLRQMFLAKNYRRELAKIQDTAPFRAWLPVVHKCADPTTCTLCVRRRVEVN